MTRLSERELWACANFVLQHHGDKAHLFVAERIGALALSGDEARIAAWRTIAQRIHSLKPSDAA